MPSRRAITTKRSAQKKQKYSLHAHPKPHVHTPTVTLAEPQRLGSKAQLLSEQCQLLYMNVNGPSLKSARLLHISNVFISNLYHLLVKVHLWEIPYQCKFCFTGNNCLQSTNSPRVPSKRGWQQRISPAMCNLPPKSLSGKLAKA